MKITDRYASAVHSSRLTVDERTTYSDTDVLASMGCADRALTDGVSFGGRPVTPAPMAVALTRLFTGDGRAAGTIVDLLASRAWKQARTMRVKLQRVEAVDMARACLAWHRDGVCRACGGHGRLRIPGSPTIGDRACKTCKGVGRIPFEREFRPDLRELARWLIVEMEREQAQAGAEAMRWIAPSLDF